MGIYNSYSIAELHTILDYFVVFFFYQSAADFVIFTQCSGTFK